MKTLGNILWHIPFLGFISAITVYLLGLILTITVVASPIGLGYMEFGKFLFWPFGNSMINKSELNIEQSKAWRAYSLLLSILFFPLGLVLSIIGVLQVVGLAITIVGIPAALVVAKSLGTYLDPVNKMCVSSDVTDELERMRAMQLIKKHVG